jgi:hypothetical protein
LHACRFEKFETFSGVAASVVEDIETNPGLPRVFQIVSICCLLRTSTDIRTGTQIFDTAQV